MKTKMILLASVAIFLTLTSRAQITLDTAKVFLAGPYDPSTGLMHDSLRVLELIPTDQPYSQSPYFKPLIGEADDETVSPAVLAMSGPTAIVDWVYIEFLDPITLNTLAAKRALVRRDGRIVSNTDGVSSVQFTSIPPGMYILKVSHRNHLSVESLNPVDFTTGVGTFNFTTGALYTRPPFPPNVGGWNHPPAKVWNGIQLLWSCDANSDKRINYNGILSNDKEPILNIAGGPNESPVGYRQEDLNMDGHVNYNGPNSDRVKLFNELSYAFPGFGITVSTNRYLTQHSH